MPWRGDLGHGGGREARPRLAFLDGLRGLAATYVVLHHAALMVPPEGLGGAAVPARFLLRHGRYAVAVFIVLSGYCLMLPVARDPQGRPPGGVVAFLGRRIRRILPAYYGALAACWLLIAIVPGLARPDHARWDRALPAWGGGVALSHLGLVHNLSERWLFKIDPPLWSVATEWQIYLLFPAWLWLRRRAGLVAAVWAGFAVGAAVAAASYPLGNPALRELCPWYLGLFALGMAAAVGSCGSASPGPAIGARSVLLASLAALLAAAMVHLTPAVRYLVAADALVGAATACLLVRWSRWASAEDAAPRPPLLRLLESGWAVAAGAFSYSVYLTHYPILGLADLWLRRAAAGPAARFWLLTVAASPVCLAVAYAFHLAFERPFLARGTGLTTGGGRPPARARVARPQRMHGRER